MLSSGMCPAECSAPRSSSQAWIGISRAMEIQESTSLFLVISHHFTISKSDNLWQFKIYFTTFHYISLHFTHVTIHQTWRSHVTIQCLDGMGNGELFYARSKELSDISTIGLSRETQQHSAVSTQIYSTLGWMINIRYIYFQISISRICCLAIVVSIWKEFTSIYNKQISASHSRWNT